MITTDMRKKSPETLDELISSNFSIVWELQDPAIAKHFDVVMKGRKPRL